MFTNIVRTSIAIGILYMSTYYRIGNENINNYYLSQILFQFQMKICTPKKWFTMSSKTLRHQPSSNLARWSSGRILASGARGPVFESR